MGGGGGRGIQLANCFTKNLSLKKKLFFGGGEGGGGAARVSDFLQRIQ